MATFVSMGSARNAASDRSEIVVCLSHWRHRFVTRLVDTNQRRAARTDRPGRTTIVESHWRQEELILPDDLSVCIGKKTLVKLILDALEGVDAQAAGCGTRTTGNPQCPPAMMLTLLTYCYATGVYASTDIELSMQHDQMIRY